MTAYKELTLMEEKRSPGTAVIFINDLNRSDANFDDVISKVVYWKNIKIIRKLNAFGCILFGSLKAWDWI